MVFNQKLGIGKYFQFLLCNNKDIEIFSSSGCLDS